MAVLSASPRNNDVQTGALAVGCAAALCLAGIMSPAQAAGGPVICPFRLLTGLPCPGCGLTRSWVFLLHGDLSGALAANPFGLVTLPAAVVLVVASGAALLRRRPLPDVGGALRSGWTRALLVVWVGYAVVRLVLVATGTATT